MFSEPADEHGAFRDHRTFRPDLVRVEVIDAVAGEDDRDTTVKAVPHVG